MSATTQAEVGTVYELVCDTKGMTRKFLVVTLLDPHDVSASAIAGCDALPKVGDVWPPDKDLLPHLVEQVAGSRMCSYTSTKAGMRALYVTCQYK